LSYLSYQTGHFFSQLLTENIYQKNLKTFTKNKQENKKQTQINAKVKMKRFKIIKRFKKKKGDYHSTWNAFGWC